MKRNSGSSKTNSRGEQSLSPDKVSNRDDDMSKSGRDISWIEDLATDLDTIRLISLSSRPKYYDYDDRTSMVWVSRLFEKLQELAHAFNSSITDTAEAIEVCPPDVFTVSAFDAPAYHYDTRGEMVFQTHLATRSTALLITGTGTKVEAYIIPVNLLPEFNHRPPDDFLPALRIDLSAANVVTVKIEENEGGEIQSEVIDFSFTYLIAEVLFRRFVERSLLNPEPKKIVRKKAKATKSRRGTLTRKVDGMLAESVASLAIFLPILILVLVVYVQAAHAFGISRQMNRAAKLAARALAQEYRKDHSIATTSTMQQAVFQKIRISKMVASNEQFAVPSGGWNVNASPPTVTVTVSYLSGIGDPPLPIFRPILCPAGQIGSSATYRLQ